MPHSDTFLRPIVSVSIIEISVSPMSSILSSCAADFSVPYPSCHEEEMFNDSSVAFLVWLYYTSSAQLGGDFVDFE